MGARPPVLIGERVLWLGSGSGLPKSGTVKWIGRLPEMGPDWAVGLELDEALPFGGIDGSWNNRKLFVCKHKHGLIVPHTSIIPQPAHKPGDTLRRIKRNTPKSGSQEQLHQAKPGSKVGRLLRALSNDESNSKLDSNDLELPSWHLRNPNLERQLAILGTLRRTGTFESGRLEGVKSEACLYSVVLEKEEYVYRERNRMTRAGRELRRSEETLHRPSSAACSSRSTGAARRDSNRSSGLFSIFRWFKRDKSDESQEDSPPLIGTLRRADGSLSGSVDTLFSTATARSFAFVPPNHYRPYGAANPPEIRINPGPETNTYKNRIRQRDLRRKAEKNVSLKEKYQLYDSETLSRSVDKINEVRETTESPSESKNSSIRRRKRPAPPPPSANKSDSNSETSLPATLVSNDENQDGRQHRRTLSEPSPTKYVRPCHIQGKRKAPQPPLDSNPGENTLSLQRKKRQAPPPPIQRSPSDEITDILRGAANDLTGSDSSLNNYETASTASTVDISQAEVVSTDTLRLERGYLKPTRGDKPMELRYTPTSPVSPRPWYKRNTASRENSFSRSSDKKKEREKRRVEDWMIESGIPRRPNQLPENKFNIFAKMDKTEEKRRSQISILTNISELDREAAEIVQKNKEREKALLDNQNNRFYRTGNGSMLNGYFNNAQHNLQVNGTQDIISLFNSVTHLADVAVSNAFYLHRNDLPTRENEQQRSSVSNERVHHVIVNSEQTNSPIVTEPQPGPSGLGKIARVTIEELDDFDKERNSRAQALYEANRLQRHQSPIIPTIKEVSESAAATPAATPSSTVANTPNDPIPPAMPGCSSAIVPAKPLQRVPAIPASVLKPVVHVVWDCPRCTLENPRWKITCEACDMWRPVPCEFKEVTPKHPLPLAVLRIVEPKDREPSVVITEITEEEPQINGSPQTNGLQLNEYRRNKSDMNLDLKDGKTKRSSQGLTISDLLFNTQGNQTPKDNIKKKDALNGLNLPPNDNKDYTNNIQQQSDVVPSKPLNTSKLVNVEDRQPTPSASGSSVSSLSSTNSDHVQAKVEQPAVKKDIVEPEEIRKARLAFFEKFGRSTSSQPKVEDKKNGEDDPAKKSDVCQQKISSTPASRLNLLGAENLPSAHPEAPMNTNLVTATSSTSEVKGVRNDANYSSINSNLDGSQIKISSSDKLESNVKASPRMRPKHSTVLEEGSVKETQTSADMNALGASSSLGEDKMKLRAILKEMKHSLPKRSKEGKGIESSKEKEGNTDVGPKLIQETKVASPKLGAIRKTPVPTPRKSTEISKASQGPNEKKAEAYLVESTTIVEEIKVKKPEKTDVVHQVDPVVRQIVPPTKPPSGKEVVVPITLEETTIQNGVLYTSVSKKAKRIGSGTFQLMRPRDFANIKAIKTGSEAAGGSEAPMYANVATNPSAASAPGTSNDEDGQKEVEMLSLQLTEPQGLAHFRAGLAISNDASNLNTIAVNRLLRRLESAIAGGMHELAAALAKELAQLKVNCVVTRQKPENAPATQIQLDMYVEDKERHQGPYPLKLRRYATVADLKAKVEREFEIPAGVQRWIIGRILANDDSATLDSLGVAGSGFPVFLYLVVPEDGEQRGLSEETALEGEEGAVGGKIGPQRSDADAAAARLQSTTSVLNDDEGAVGGVIPDQVAASVDKLPVIASGQNDLESANSNPAKTSKETDGTSWKCGRCTLVNLSHRIGCGACGSSREQEEPQIGEIPQRPRRKEKHVDNTEDSNAENGTDREKTRDYQKLVDLEKSDLIISTEPFDCPVCLTDYQSGDGVVLRECLHVFCRPCLANTVEYSDEAEVKCPYRDNNYTCDSTLLEREIKSLVTPDVYERHLAKSIALAEKKIGNAFHCKTPDCKGWCIFEDNVNTFRCPVCTRPNCLTCQAIHEGLDCKQFQEQLSKDSEINAESKRTKEMLQEMVERGEAMNCPTCQVVLMKKWGCDWLRCSMCKTEICWITRGARWGPNGKGDTSGGCQCGVNGVKCHPKCTYCH